MHTTHTRARANTHTHTFAHIILLRQTLQALAYIFLFFTNPSTQHDNQLAKTKDRLTHLVSQEQSIITAQRRYRQESAGSAAVKYVSLVSP